VRLKKKKHQINTSKQKQSFSCSIEIDLLFLCFAMTNAVPPVACFYKCLIKDLVRDA
jgi:hypothetical protein